MKQERRQNGRCNRVARLEKPDRLSEARDFSHGFFTYGKILVRASRWYPSSKTCHHCGYKNDDLRLSDRVYVCPVCGNIMPRDKNAAINILEEGLRTIKENMIRPSVEGYSKPSLITTIA